MHRTVRTGLGRGPPSPAASRRKLTPPNETLRLHAPGPFSIVVSAADGRIVVLRNGVRIGSAPARIGGDLPTIGVFTLSRIDAEGFHWLQVGLPGQEQAADHAVTPEERGRHRIDLDFLASLRAILEPGATAIVTPRSLASASSGQRLVVGDSHSDE